MGSIARNMRLAEELLQLKKPTRKQIEDVRDHMANKFQTAIAEEDTQMVITALYAGLHTLYTMLAHVVGEDEENQNTNKEASAKTPEPLRQSGETIAPASSEK